MRFGMSDQEPMMASSEKIVAAPLVGASGNMNISPATMIKLIGEPLDAPCLCRDDSGPICVNENYPKWGIDEDHRILSDG